MSLQGVIMWTKNAPSAGIFQLIPCNPFSSYTFLPHYEFDEFIQKTFPFHLCSFAMGKLKIRLEIAWTVCTTTASRRIRSKFPQSAYDAKNDDDDKKRRKGKLREENMILLYKFWVYSFSIDLIHIRFLHAAICIRDQNIFLKSIFAFLFCTL